MTCRFAAGKNVPSRASWLNFLTYSLYFYSWGFIDGHLLSTLLDQLCYQTLYQSPKYKFNLKTFNLPFQNVNLCLYTNNMGTYGTLRSKSFQKLLWHYDPRPLKARRGHFLDWLWLFTVMSHHAHWMTLHNLVLSCRCKGSLGHGVFRYLCCLWI